RRRVGWRRWGKGNTSSRRLLSAMGDPRLEEDGFDFDQAECYWSGRWFPRQSPNVFTRRPRP
ncbi:MAG: hypothetical protein R6V07_11670, partial [Armatimonadota bacterium]